MQFNGITPQLEALTQSLPPSQHEQQGRPRSLYQFLVGAVTNYHKFPDSKQNEHILFNPGGWKFQFIFTGSMSAELIPSRNSPWATALQDSDSAWCVKGDQASLQIWDFKFLIFTIASLVCHLTCFLSSLFCSEGARLIVNTPTKLSLMLQDFGCPSTVLYKDSFSALFASLCIVISL